MSLLEGMGGLASLGAWSEGFTRRRWFAVTAFTTLGAWQYASASERAQDQSPRQRSLKIESTGTLELDPSGQKPVSSPFQVRAEFAYSERLDREADRYWAARRYRKAEARIQVGSGSTVSKLSDINPVVVETAREIDERRTEFRLDRTEGPLTRNEVDLLKLPVVSPAMTAWFQDASKKALGDSWKPENWAVAAALGIDSVLEHDITCRVRSTNAERIEIEVRGSASGAADDIATEIQLNGRCTLDTKSGRLTSTSWDVQERRALGAATPGFTARTKLELTDQGAASWSADDETQFQQIRAAAIAGPVEAQLVFESKHHGFRLSHSSRWRCIADNSQQVILRMVDRGDLIAQAHVTRLQPLPGGAKLSAQRYRQDVSEAIGDGGGRIVDVSEFETARGYQGIRVIVSAEVSGVPIQWIYLHVSDDAGRRAGWVFTIEQDRLDRLGIEDQTLLEAFELLDLPEGAQPGKPAATANRPSGSSAEPTRRQR